MLKHLLLPLALLAASVSAKAEIERHYLSNGEPYMVDAHSQQNTDGSWRHFLRARLIQTREANIKLADVTCNGGSAGWIIIRNSQWSDPLTYDDYESDANWNWNAIGNVE